MIITSPNEAFGISLGLQVLGKRKSTAKHAKNQIMMRETVTNGTGQLQVPAFSKRGNPGQPNMPTKILCPPIPTVPENRRAAQTIPGPCTHLTGAAVSTSLCLCQAGKPQWAWWDSARGTCDKFKVVCQIKIISSSIIFHHLPIFHRIQLRSDDSQARNPWNQLRRARDCQEPCGTKRNQVWFNARHTKYTLVSFRNSKSAQLLICSSDLSSFVEKLKLPQGVQQGTFSPAFSCFIFGLSKVFTASASLLSTQDCPIRWHPKDILRTSCAHVASAIFLLKFWRKPKAKPASQEYDRNEMSCN